MDSKQILESARGALDGSLSFCLFCGIIVLTAVSCRSASVVPPAKSSLTDGLKVSDNHHYLVDAKTGAPVFILADTAWNLGALKGSEERGAGEEAWLTMDDVA